MSTLFPEAGTMPAIEKASRSQYLALKEFFEAWPVAVPIMAERLRRAGYNITTRQLHAMVSSPRPQDRHLGDYALRVVLLEMRNDIDKVLRTESHDNGHPA